MAPLGDCPASPVSEGNYQLMYLNNSLSKAPCFSLLVAPDVAENRMFSQFSWPAILESYIPCSVTDLSVLYCFLLPAGYRKNTFFINISNI